MMTPSLLGKGMTALIGVVVSSGVVVLATMPVVSDKLPPKSEAAYAVVLAILTCLLLSVFVFGVTGARPPPSDNDGTDALPPFVSEKRLCERDYLILDMLNSRGHERVSFCVTDPRLDDNPVIYISTGFSKLTGYDFADIVGKNCRFLQGPKTDEADRRRIREAIRHERDCNVNLLNHKKDGTVFVNEFFLTTLRTPEKAVAYYVGIQVAVAKSGPGQMPSNPGWVYTLGNHA